MKLYNVDGSPNCFRVRMVIEELGLKVDYIDVDLRARTPEFLALNPGGKVPVFVDDDGFALFESRSINAYLAAKRPERGLYPTDPKRRALVDQWSYWQAIHLGPAMQAVAFERVGRAAFKMGNPDEALAAAKLEETTKLLPVLEAGLTGKDYLVDALTLADIAAVTTFTVRKAAGISVDAFPAVARWLDRMEALPSFEKALPNWVREVRAR